MRPVVWTYIVPELGKEPLIAQGPEVELERDTWIVDCGAGVVVVSIVYEQVQVPFVTFTEVFTLLALHAVEGGCTPAPNAEQLHL